MHVLEEPPHLHRFPPISNVCAASSLVDTRIGALVDITTLSNASTSLFFYLLVFLAVLFGACTANALERLAWWRAD